MQKAAFQENPAFQSSFALIVAQTPLSSQDPQGKTGRNLPEKAREKFRSGREFPLTFPGEIGTIYGMKL
jgi:hypothetical protein